MNKLKDLLLKSFNLPFESIEDITKTIQSFHTLSSDVGNKPIAVLTELVRQTGVYQKCSNLASDFVDAVTMCDQIDLIMDGLTSYAEKDAAFFNFFDDSGLNELFAYAFGKEPLVYNPVRFTSMFDDWFDAGSNTIESCVGNAKGLSVTAILVGTDDADTLSLKFGSNVIFEVVCSKHLPGITKYYDHYVYNTSFSTTDGLWYNLEQAEDELNDVTFSNSLINELLSNATFDGNINVESMRRVVSTYGDCSAKEYLTSALAGVDTGSYISILSILAEYLSDNSGDYSSGNDYFTPKVQGAYITSIINVVVTFAITIISVILSICFQAVGVVISMILNVISTIISTVVQKISDTAVSTINERYSALLPTYNRPINDAKTYDFDSDIDHISNNTAINDMFIASNGICLMSDACPNICHVICKSSDRTLFYQKLLTPWVVYGTSKVKVAANTMNGVMQFGYLYDSSGSGYTQMEYDATESWVALSDADRRKMIMITIISRLIQFTARDVSELISNPYTYGSLSAVDIHLHVGDPAYYFNDAEHYPEYQDEDGQRCLASLFLRDILDTIGFQSFPAPSTSDWVSYTEGFTSLNETISDSEIWEWDDINGWLDVECWQPVIPDLEIESLNVQPLIQNRVYNPVPCFIESVYWPTQSKRSILTAFWVTALTAAAAAGVAYICKRSRRTSATARLAVREAEFNQAKDNFLNNPTSITARRQFNRANKRLTRAWSRAAKAGLQSYNGFSTGSTTPYDTAAKASSMFDLVQSSTISTNSNDSIYQDQMNEIEREVDQLKRLIAPIF